MSAFRVKNHVCCAVVIAKTLQQAVRMFEREQRKDGYKGAYAMASDAQLISEYVIGAK